MKKFFALILAVVISITVLTANLVADSSTVLGTLSYWYSDGEYIARWSVTNIGVYMVGLHGSPSSLFYSGMSRAASLWSSTLGITVTANTTNTSPEITFYGGTQDELNAEGTFTVDSSYDGLTRSYTKVEGTWNYGTTTIEGRTLTSAYGYVLMTDSYSQAHYNNVALHELGHALGWRGHSSETTDVMYKSSSSSRVNLTTRDKNHLAQVY